MNPIENKEITIGTRLGSMLLDHVIMVILMIPFYIPLLLSKLSTAFKVSHNQTNSNYFDGTFGYIAVFGFSLYICKDMLTI